MVSFIVNSKKWSIFHTDTFKSLSCIHPILFLVVMNSEELDIQNVWSNQYGEERLSLCLTSLFIFTLLLGQEGETQVMS